MKCWEENLESTIRRKMFREGKVDGEWMVVVLDVDSMDTHLLIQSWRRVSNSAQTTAHDLQEDAKTRGEGSLMSPRK